MGSAREVGVKYMHDMAAIWISLGLLLLIGNVASDVDPTICSLFKRSDGLIPPPLPTNFELKGERVDHLNNFTIYEEMYFDYTNQWAKYVYMNKSIEHHLLFDYETSQVVEWDIIHPGVGIKRDPLSQSCAATDMDDSSYRNIFGYQDSGNGLRPKMYTSNQALRYGGPYMSAANGTGKLDERGLLADNFISCLYDSSMDATMKTSYFFSNEKVEPSGATLAQDVIGFEDGYLSVPVKIKYEGIMPDENKVMRKFNTTLSISWFKAEPKFKFGTFQIPKWIYCTDYRGRKDMPKFPTAFSTRLTLTQFQVDVLGNIDTAEVGTQERQDYETIFYYGEKNLARRDFTPSMFLDTEIFSKFQSYSPVSTIYDFNQGLLYTINKPTGRCYIRPIRENDYFDTHKPILYRKLATPEEVFMMETDEMEYKGKTFTRDIECDVWTGKFYDARYNTTLVKETYISTNGWHELADEMVEYGVPVKHVVIRTELNDELMEGVATYNFLKFKSKAPRLVLFDINNCVEYIKHQQYAIVLDVDADVRGTITQYQFNFLETAQFYLADVTKVLTPLRIQRLELRQKRSSAEETLTFLVFTMLDKPDLSGLSVLVSTTGSTLEEAVVNLQQLMDRGGFTISFYPPGSKEEIIVHANPGDLYIVKAGGNLTPAPLFTAIHQTPETNTDSDAIPIVQHDDDEPVEVVQKGMTPGHLALLAFAMLFIGIGIGIASMYLYVRMYDERKLEDRITMTVTKSALERDIETPSTSNDY